MTANSTTLYSFSCGKFNAQGFIMMSDHHSDPILGKKNVRFVPLEVAKLSVLFGMEKIHK